MQQGGALELRNTGLRIPEGLAGSKMTIVYRLLGFGPAKDAEFTYEWIGGPSVVGTRSDGGQVPALEGTWAYKGTVNTISRGSGEPLVFTNYGGSSSRGRFIDASSVVAIDWEGGLRGSLHDGGNTIRWANGTVWFRPRSEGR